MTTQRDDVVNRKQVYTFANRAQTAVKHFKEMLDYNQTNCIIPFPQERGPRYAFSCTPRCIGTLTNNTPRSVPTSEQDILSPFYLRTSHIVALLLCPLTSVIVTYSRTKQSIISHLPAPTSDLAKLKSPR